MLQTRRCALYAARRKSRLLTLGSQVNWILRQRGSQREDSWLNGCSASMGDWWWLVFSWITIPYGKRTPSLTKLCTPLTAGGDWKAKKRPSSARSLDFETRTRIETARSCQQFPSCRLTVSISFIFHRLFHIIHPRKKDEKGPRQLTGAVSSGLPTCGSKSKRLLSPSVALPVVTSQLPDLEANGGRRFVHPLWRWFVWWLWSINSFLCFIIF